MTLRETLGTDVTARYVELITTDKTATRLARQAATGTDYETANLYAVRSGELMAQALADETQTLAYMSYDVAQGTLMPLMTANHEAVTAVTAAIQGNMNAAAGVGLAPVIPALDTSRIDGLAVVAAQADTMEQARQALAEPLVNSSQSVVDRSIRDNAQANSKAGIGATIERKTEAAGTREAPLRVRYKNKVYTYTRKYNVPCNWCANLAGVYEYRNGGRNIPRDVFRRHESCRCTLTYRNGVNRQDVWNHNKVWTVDDAEEQTSVVAAAQPTPPVKPNNDLYNKMGDPYYTAMSEAGENAPENNKKLWAKYEDRIKVASTAHTGTAYAQGEYIYVNLADDMNPTNGYDKPWQTFRHECHHVIDTLAARDNGAWYHYSSYYQNGLFPATIKKEVQQLVADRGVIVKQLVNAGDLDELIRIGAIPRGDRWYYESGYTVLEYKKAMAYNVLQAEVRQIPMSARCDLSDILQGASNEKLQCGFGHSRGYWKARTYNGVPDGLATEAFAEMSDSVYTNPESLAVIKQYLPKSFAVYEEMVESLLE